MGDWRYGEPRFSERFGDRGRGMPPGPSGGGGGGILGPSHLLEESSAKRRREYGKLATRVNVPMEKWCPSPFSRVHLCAPGLLLSFVGGDLFLHELCQTHRPLAIPSFRTKNLLCLATDLPDCPRLCFPLFSPPMSTWQTTVHRRWLSASPPCTHTTAESTSEAPLCRLWPLTSPG